MPLSSFSWLGPSGSNASKTGSLPHSPSYSNSLGGFSLRLLSCSLAPSPARPSPTPRLVVLVRWNHASSTRALPCACRFLQTLSCAAPLFGINLDLRLVLRVSLRVSHTTVPCLGNARGGGVDPDFDDEAKKIFASLGVTGKGQTRYHTYLLLLRCASRCATARLSALRTRHWL
jgi:hypothetical protein